MKQKLPLTNRLSRRQLLAGIGIGSVLFAAPSRAKQQSAFIHLNTGSLGTPLEEANLAMAKAIDILGADPVGNYWGSLSSKANEARSIAASFLGCDVSEIAFTACTTEGMNAAALGLDLKAGDRVLTTDHEHAGGSVCWQYLAKKRGIIIDQVELPVPPQSAEQLVPAFADRITDRTRVISVSHITSTTGLRMPVEKLADLAHSNQALMFVDGAQSAGAIAIDLHDMQCDVYVTSGHKWLCGPIGTGLLYVRQQARAEVDPVLLQSGPGAYTGATGTRNLPSFIGLGVAMGSLAKRDPKKVEANNLQLRAVLQDGLEKVPAVKILSPDEGDLISPLLSFQIPGVDPSELANTMREKHGIVIKVLGGKVIGNRISTHYYNTTEHVDRLLSALKSTL